MESDKFLLKLFSGPQVGGEAELQPGEYLVGREPSCDLVLDDVLVEPSHCRLSIRNNALELTPLEGSVYLEGEQFSGGAIEPYQYVMLGGTCLAVGRPETPWPVRPIPAIRREEPNQTAESQTPQESGASDELEDRRRGRGRWLIPLSATLLLGLLIAGATALAPSHRRADAADNAAPLEDRLWEIVRSQQVESDVQVESTDRGWIVRGYLEKEQDRIRLTQQLKELLPLASIRLWDSETLAVAAGGVLSGLHVSLTATPGGPGEVIVEGTLKNRQDWEKARQRIGRDVTAIRKLTDRVQLESELAQRKASPTREPPKPTTTEIEYVASGDVAPDGASPTVIRNIYLLPPDTEAPALPSPDIRSVAIGAHRSILMSDGTRVMIGGRLDGWMVMQIEEDRVVLERNQYRHIVDLLKP